MTKEYINIYFRFSLNSVLLISIVIFMYQCLIILNSRGTKFENSSSPLPFEKVNVAETENGLVKIYWELIGMKQDDPKLIGKSIL